MCSPGKRVLGGGYSMPDGYAAANSSRPAGAGGWEVVPPPNYGSAFDFTVYAICAFADPAV